MVSIVQLRFMAGAARPPVRSKCIRMTPPREATARSRETGTKRARSTTLFRSAKRLDDDLIRTPSREGENSRVFSPPRLGGLGMGTLDTPLGHRLNCLLEFVGQAFQLFLESAVPLSGGYPFASSFAPRARRGGDDGNADFRPG